MPRRPPPGGQNRPSEGRNRPLAARYEPWRLGPERPAVFTEHRMATDPIVDTHRHEVLEIAWCREGRATFVVGDKTIACGAGDLLVIGPREAHRASAAAAGSSWWFAHLDLPRLLDGVADPEGVAAAAQLAGADFPNLLAAGSRPARIAELLVAAVRDRSPGWLSEARGLALALLAGLRRLPGRVAPAPEAAVADRLAPGLLLMSQRYRHALGVPALARACGLGETTFRRAFAAAFGHGPKEHLIRLRLAHAEARLRAGDAVAAAATAAGFASARALHRAFRDRHGCAPRAWLDRPAPGG